MIVDHPALSPETAELFRSMPDTPESREIKADFLRAKNELHCCASLFHADANDFSNLSGYSSGSAGGSVFPAPPASLTNPAAPTSSSGNVKAGGPKQEVNLTPPHSRPEPTAALDDASRAALLGFERQLEEMQRKRKAEFEEEERQWELKRQASRQAWEKKCMEEDAERERRVRAQDEALQRRFADEEAAHAARLAEMEAKQRKTLQEERDAHEAHLVQLIEQQSSVLAAADAAKARLGSMRAEGKAEPCTVVALAAPRGPAKEDLKAKLREKTTLCRQASQECFDNSAQLETPPSYTKAPSSDPGTAPSSATSPASTTATASPASVVATVPSQPAHAAGPAQGVNLAFNSSTHPQAWGALYRISRSADCPEEIKKAWDAGAPAWFS